MALVMIGFILRIGLNVMVSRNMSFFSSGAKGGDAGAYELRALVIVDIWKSEGIQFIDAQNHPDVELGGVELVCNLYALIDYLCDDRATVGCTAAVALVACLLVVIIYRFAREVGASETAAFRASMLWMFGPSFLYHTSDTYKDGFNAFFVITALYMSSRLAKRFSVTNLLIIAPVLWCLWHVRRYMVFMCVVPLLVGFLGADRLSIRNILAGVVLLAGFVMASASGAFGSTLSSAGDTYSIATSGGVLRYNAASGSGVDFGESDNPWAAYPIKLLYTVFAPFPWMPGSLGLQIGKLDALIWYYILYGAVKSVPNAWKTHRPTLVTLVVFIVPATLAYALTMSNVGLILRQRMPIMIATTVLATLWWTERERLVARPAPTLAPSQRRLPLPRSKRALT